MDHLGLFTFLPLAALLAGGIAGLIVARLLGLQLLLWLLGALAAVAFNIFVLLYVPCVVAVADMRQEFGSRWTWAQIGYTLGLAWLGAVVVFQVGKLFV